MAKVEYRVRPVTRYIVTRFHDDGQGGCGVETCGEFDNERQAQNVATALRDFEVVVPAATNVNGDPPGGVSFGQQIGGETADRFPLRRDD